MYSFRHHEHGHDHDHNDNAMVHTHLTSVGVDIGSSTSHLMFSRLTVGFPSVHQRRPEVLDRQVISRSPVSLTPFADSRDIEAGPLADLVGRAFRDAGLNPDSVDTGAIIITGEAARRNNAQRIVELLSDQAGRFVCATAGPRLEAILAAHGSGAIARSREEISLLLHLDVGGGTTKVNLIRQGSILGTSALNIGARLVAVDANDRLVRIEPAGHRILKDAGLDCHVGGVLAPDIRKLLARRMASVLFDSLSGADAPWADYSVIQPFNLPERVTQLLFSGGVAEYIYNREARAFGDLGPDLGEALTAEAVRRGYEILDATEGIRATVIGAAEYSVQMSGETIFLPDPAKLPMRNLRTFVIPINRSPAVADEVERRIQTVVRERDPEVTGDPFAVFISTPPFSGYALAHELADGINRGLSSLDPDERPDLMVFEQNFGQLIGKMLSPGIPCIDEVRLSELDFIDVGELVPGEDYVPVVVKSLAFGT
ncbi:MAG: hypothetical protein GEU73_00085 [Chloroflexi bacterium]|nr:hypothetical protein [Chloroflexota bacterium]